MKIIHWFQVMKEVLQHPAVRRENIHNMDETGVMLGMVGTYKIGRRLAILRGALEAAEIR